MYRLRRTKLFKAQIAAVATRSPLELNAQNPHSRSARKCIDCNGHQITLVIRYIWNGIGLPSASLPAGPRSAADLDGKHANYNVFELSLDMNVLLPQNTRFCSHKLRHTFVIPSSYLRHTIAHTMVNIK